MHWEEVSLSSQVNPEKVINIILTDEDKENNYALNGFLFHLFYNS